MIVGRCYVQLAAIRQWYLLLHIMFLILYYFCPSQFIVFFNLVSIRVNGQQYLHCPTYAHFTRVIVKGPILQIIVFDVYPSSFSF